MGRDCRLPAPSVDAEPVGVAIQEARPAARMRAGVVPLLAAIVAAAVAYAVPLLGPLLVALVLGAVLAELEARRRAGAGPGLRVRKAVAAARHRASVSAFPWTTSGRSASAVSPWWW